LQFGSSFCGFISLLIGRETINIPEFFSGVHGFTGKTVILSKGLYFQAARRCIPAHENVSITI